MITYYIPQSDIAAVGNQETVATIHRVVERHFMVTDLTRR